MPRIYHAVTPGDHYSPRTGSAIPTVVHGLVTGTTAAGDAAQWTHSVVLDESTYPERYGDCGVVEYTGAPRPDARAAAADRVRGRLGMPRRAERAYYAPLVDSLRDAEPGIVVAHNALTLPTALKDGRHRTIVYAHNELPRSMSKRELDRLISPAAAIVCVSSALAEVTADRLPRGLRDRVHVVCNGVDTSLFSPGAAPVEPPRIVFVGRMIAEKGADVLLRAAARIPAGLAELTLIGSHGFDAHAALTDYEAELRSLAKHVRIPVTFMPFIDRASLPEELRRARVLVVPSRWREPSALTAGEGLASGLAVVVSDVGGIPEVIGDAGITVPVENPDALADALIDLLGDPDALRALGHRARQRAEARDWQWSWLRLRSVLAAV